MGSLYRVLGGAPAPLVSLALRLTAIDRLVPKPLVLATRMHDRDLADVRVPVLSVAGEGDVLAPAAAVHHVAELLPGATEVRLETAPGGHLGVLAGRSARHTTWRHLDEFLERHDARPLTEARAA